MGEIIAVVLRAPGHPNKIVHAESDGKPGEPWYVRIPAFEHDSYPPVHRAVLMTEETSLTNTFLYSGEDDDEGRPVFDFESGVT